MGGAAGHILHVAENLNLTFGEVKEIIQSAAEGRLENVSEKLDGINLVFTYDVLLNELKVARNGGDIKSGGMDATLLAKKFFGRGNVEEAFNIAFKVLNQALNSLSGDVQIKVFGEEANKWYSMEIIYANSPNTIIYDGSSIVFHGWPVFELDESGKIKQTDDATGINILTSQIENMQKAVSVESWQVRGPSLLAMKKMTDGSIAESFFSSLSEIMSSANVGDSDTMYDYLRSLMSVEVEQLGLSPETIDSVIERAIKAPGCPGVPELKKIIPKQLQPTVSQFIKNADKFIVKNMMQPIENAINDFVIELLRGIDSTLISDSGAEVERLKSSVRKAIGAIESSGNQLAMDVLQKEMARLRDVENITVAMEGIVFFYRNQTYKFTGPFSSFHQILSLFTFGRKGVPPMKIENVILARVMKNLFEGGHMFSTDSVPLELFNTMWPALESDVISLGCTSVKPIGSTGKKDMMGDIDLAVEFSGSRDELLDNAAKTFGEDAVSKVGANIVTIMYPVDDQYFQVDLMIGDTNYLSWSRFGTSNVESHADYSPLKGVARNILFAVINRIAAPLIFPTSQHSDVDRTQFSVDFDRGLFKVSQTKRNKKEGKPSTKSWRTLEKELVSSDPDAIAQVMFGKQIMSKDLLRFEDVVEALHQSPVLSGLASKILTTFSQEMKELVIRNPNILGDDPEAALAYIDEIIQ